MAVRHAILGINPLSFPIKGLVSLKSLLGLRFLYLSDLSEFQVHSPTKMSKYSDPLWYAPKPYQPKDRLTFGVEIEVALASLPKDREDPNPEDLRACYGVDDGDFPHKSENARRHIARTLERANLQVEFQPGSSTDAFGYKSEWVAKDPSSWVVKMDEDVLPPEGAGTVYQWHGIELNSPPLYYSEDAVKEVMFVLELMSNTYRCALTRRTALHVHVGNGAKGFSAETIQKLLSTYWTFEPQIELIHPLFRIDNQATASLRRGSDLAKGVLVERSKRNNKGFIEYILQDRNRDIAKLEMMSKSVAANVTDEDRSAVNIQPLAMAVKYGGTKKTIEFRQHTSTLDPQELAHWINLVVGILEFADTVEKDALVPFLDEYIDKTPREFGLEKALVKLGMPSEAKYFGKVAADMSRLKAASKRNADAWVLTGITQNK